ncbi:MAG: sigma-70 family RNA polymerase sigma factor [Candidatus Udaeobacter sp.]
MSVSLIDISVEDRLEACLPNQARCLTSKDFSRGIAPSSVYALDRNTMDASEREQYQGTIHGDRAAFEMIIRKHSRTLFAIAYGILQNREEAEDVVQDSLVRAWKTRRRVRDPEKFPAWLATIARHRAHDVFRKRRTVLLSDQAIKAIDPEPPVTTVLDQQLHSALADLPELHRAALTLRYFEEQDYQSIENALGLTNGALRGILGRALASLRKQLRPAVASMD